MIDKDETISHESFGVIRLARASGPPGPLFDSAVDHQHVMVIEVDRAEQKRDLYHSWVFGRETVVRLYMSEAQFARFVSSVGDGSGVPCTLRQIGGKQLEDPPRDKNTRDTFEREVNDKFAAMAVDAAAALSSVDKIMQQPRITKRDLSEIRDTLYHIEQNLRTNMGFAQKTFAETIEKTVVNAKIEIEAHAQLVARRVGIAAPLAPTVAEIENREKDHDHL